MADHDPKDARTQTAYHEAAHAVVSFELRRGVGKVSIIPEGDSVGCIANRFQSAFRPDINADTATRDKCEREILILLAGEIAEARLCGREPKLGDHGSLSDYHKIADFGFRVCGGEEETTAYLNWLFVRTCGMIQNEHYWFPIIRLANVLLDKGQMSGRAARKVWLDALDELMTARRSRGRAGATNVSN